MDLDITQDGLEYNGWTTLVEIREHSPCSDGWQKLLAHLGKTMADDAPLHIRGPAWQGMDTAPKGEWVERQTGKGVARVHVPKRIIALMSDGDWTVSYWVEKGERWNMFTKDSPPLAWCLPPCADAMLAAREASE